MLQGFSCSKEHVYEINEFLQSLVFCWCKRIASMFLKVCKGFSLDIKELYFCFMGP